MDSAPLEGYSLRTSPDYNTKCCHQGNFSFPSDTLLLTRGRTIGEYGDLFVRVKHSTGTWGWLFITRQGGDCLEIVKTVNDMYELEREITALE